MELKKYKHEAPYSYTLGMAPTLELIQCRPASVDKIYIHPNYTPKDDAYNIFEVCKRTHLPYEVNKKVFDRLSGKENVFVLGSFFKYDAPILPDLPHVVLVNPSNAGNLGTIIRTSLGFGFKDLVIIRPGVDPYDPKTIRASMGALFHIRLSFLDSFEEYCQQFPDHKIYTFMLKGKRLLSEIKREPRKPFALVFGNEATGLPDSFLDYGESIFINHSKEIDSLNLSIAFGIAANAFSVYETAKTS